MNVVLTGQMASRVTDSGFEYETAFWVSNLSGWFFHQVGAHVQGLKKTSFPPHASIVLWLLKLEVLKSP